jgi:hypothetical protein
MIELLYEVLQSIERTRGSPEQLYHVDRLVIRPLLQALSCIMVVTVIVGAVVVAFLLGDKQLSLGPAIGRVAAPWFIGGAGVLTLGWTLARRKVRRWRRRGQERQRKPLTFPPPSRQVAPIMPSRTASVRRQARTRTHRNRSRAQTRHPPAAESKTILAAQPATVEDLSNDPIGKGA